MQQRSNVLLPPSSSLVHPSRRRRLHRWINNKNQTQRRRLWPERTAVRLLLLLAWAWILASATMLLMLLLRQRRSTTALHQNVSSNVEEEEEESFSMLPQRSLTPPQQKAASSTSSSFQLKPYESPLLIFTCQRAEYLRRTLERVVEYLQESSYSINNDNNNDNFCDFACPIIISQDGTDAKVQSVVKEFQEILLSKKSIPLVHLQHNRPNSLRGAAARNAYRSLAVHYGWALGRVFQGHARPPPQDTAAAAAVPLPQRVMILEEDIEIASDFFDYFRATAKLLEDGESQHVLAVSAFNDNGAHASSSSKSASERILRSDFFPGLGWMMPRWLWELELESKWPDGYWDDWLREPAQRQGRHILRPEVSRTFHFGTKGGASHNQFGNLLTQVQLNQVPVDWAKQDLTYLEYDKYDEHYWNLISSAVPANDLQAALEQVRSGNARLEYASFSEFQGLARHLHLMDDEKAGIPRTAYKGVVETRPYEEFLLFLIPPLEQLRLDMGMQ